MKSVQRGTETRRNTTLFGHFMIMRMPRPTGLSHIYIAGLFSGSQQVAWLRPRLGGSDPES